MTHTAADVLILTLTLHNYMNHSAICSNCTECQKIIFQIAYYRPHTVRILTTSIMGHVSVVLYADRQKRKVDVNYRVGQKPDLFER